MSRSSPTSSISKTTLRSQQRGEVQRVAALEEPAGGAEPQAAEPDLDEPADVVGDLLAVPDLVDHRLGGALQVAQGRVARVVRRARRASPSARSQPSSS